MRPFASLALYSWASNRTWTHERSSPSFFTLQHEKKELSKPSTVSVLFPEVTDSANEMGKAHASRI